jgi:hypothetical protein
MSVYDDRPERPNSLGGLWSAVIATSATDITDQVYVTIAGFHSKFRWGPCRWTPRGDSNTFPTRGDKAIIMFDETKTPYIIGWWPF